MGEIDKEGLNKVIENIDNGIEKDLDTMASEIKSLIPVISKDQRIKLIADIFGSTIETMEINNNDMIILRGQWTEDMIKGFVGSCNAVGMSNRIMVLMDNQNLETMGIKQFYELMVDLKKEIDSMGA